MTLKMRKLSHIQAMQTEVPGPAPRSLHEWMERTGTNGTRLLAMLHDRGMTMSPGMLSLLLKGSRRCSYVKALVLSDITGVPWRELTRWPRSSDPEKDSGRRSKRGR